MAVPYTFGSATTSIPLSQLDSNFATAITLGNTAVQLGNTITTLTGVTNVASGTSLTLGSNGNTTAVTIDTSQNVGIGTSSPAAKLNVVAGDAASATNQVNISGGRSLGTGVYGSAGSILFTNGYWSSGYGAASISGMDSGGSGGYLGFATTTNGGGTTGTPTERMRIGSDGTVFVNTTTSVSAGKFIVAANSTTTNAIVIQDTSTSYGAGVYFQTFVNSTGNLAGYVAHTGSTTVNFGSVSDYRLKENVTPVTNSLAKICQLKPVSYKWKEDGSFGEGFIAHELQEIIPLAVDGEKDAIGLDDKIKPQGVDPSKVVVHLVAAIQEQQALITALTDRITAQDADIAALKAKVGI